MSHLILPSKLKVKKTSNLETKSESLKPSEVAKETVTKKSVTKEPVAKENVSAKEPLVKEPTEPIIKKSRKSAKEKEKLIVEKTIEFDERSSKTKEASSLGKSERKSKIGTYASTEFQNWLCTPIQKTKIKRSKKMNDEAFQIFQDFCGMTNNEEWKTFFQKLYTGKFPHGYSYRNQTLFFRKRTKIEKLDIQDGSLDTMMKVMNFFQIYGGFENSDDNLNIFDYLVSKSESYNQWKDIRSKKTKQFFVTKYADELTTLHNLNPSERRALLDTIHAGFILKCIDTSDIVFENRRITDIKTLIWNEEKRDFELKADYKNLRTSRKNVSEKHNRNSFAAHWSRFLSQMVRENKPNEVDISTDASNFEDLTDVTSISISTTTE